MPYRVFRGDPYSSLVLGFHAMLRQLLLGILYVAACSSLLAEPPDITALFPAGGRRGTEVSVRLQGKVDTASVQAWFDRPGIEFLGADGKDGVKFKLAADAPRGTTWLRFHNADGASALKPFQIGGSPEMLEIEPNETLPKAQRLAELPVVVNGTLEKAGEVDTFQIALQRGKTLVAALAAKQAVGSPMDGLLQVVDSRGFVLEQNDDQRGFDPRIVFIAPKDGDYFVRVFAFPVVPDTNVRFSGAPGYVYRLLLTTGSFLDRVTPGAVIGNQPAKVRPGGWNLPSDAGDIQTPPFALGVHALFPDGWESTAKVLATPLPVVTEQEPNPLAQPQLVVVPGTVTGVIGTAKDVDAWKFTAKAGQKLSLRLTARSLGSELDAVVRIYDAAGQKTAEVDDAPQDVSDIAMEFTAPKDGEYVVAVTDRFAHGGPGFGYALSLMEPQPACLLQAAAEAFVVKGETPLEIPVTVERRLGFALPVKISVEGLPDGVTTEPLVSEPQGDSSKLVKLVVKSTRAERWTGPIRITGRAEGDPATDRLARFKSPLTDDWLPHLWLTALPK